jgi:hypothetical protein
MACWVASYPKAVGRAIRATAISRINIDLIFPLSSFVLKHLGKTLSVASEPRFF